MKKIFWNKIQIIIKNKNQKYLQFRNCPVCSCNKSVNVNSMNDFQFYTDDDNKSFVDINNVMCVNCDTVYMNPCFSDLGFSELFKEAGNSYGMSSERPDEIINFLYENNLIGKNTRLLDLGCGSGNFINKLKGDIICLGVDIDQPSIDYAISINSDDNKKFLCRKFDDLHFDFKPNLITLFHVLEHLNDPLSVLKNIYKICEINSILIVEVPTLENGFTNDLMSFFSPQHLTHFSYKSLINSIYLSGWNIEKIHQCENYNGTRIVAKKADIIQSELCDFDLNIYQSLMGHINNINYNYQKILDSIESNYVVIYGGGVHLEKIYQTFTNFFDERKRFIIIDGDNLKIGKKWRGINIYHPDIINELDISNCQFLISSYQHQEIMYNNLIKFGVDRNMIFKFYNEIYVN